MDSDGAIWTPDADRVAGTAIARFARQLDDPALLDYGALWAWSVEHLNEFWISLWDFFDIAADGDPGVGLVDAVMPGARWFPGTRLNYAEHALRWCRVPERSQEVAVTEIGEDGRSTSTTWAQLGERVAAFAGWLRQAGVRSGDRVVGYLPNSTEALVAFLAAASLGAVWSACGQDYSGQGAAARFGQLEPVVLVAADGYWWKGQSVDRRWEVSALQRALPTLRRTVHVPRLGLPTVGNHSPGDVSWEKATASPAGLRFERVAFDAPLWVLFSSGTTGLPKGIVHGHGGVLLEHCKLLGLHLDVGPGQPLFWHTTTNWMMWNIVASGLLVGAPVVLYDGSPVYPGPQRLWQIAADYRVAVLGVSPGYLLASARAGLAPGRELDLGALRVIGSTGAPLPASSYYWVHDAVGPEVQLASTSGGTDVVTGFAGSSPTTPVWPGEISAPGLGVALEAWDETGKPVAGQVGELVITKPMPSMPLYLWNDQVGSRYRDTYFAAYPGVWRHGDWIEVTARGSVVISGRSDSTLNRNGVRLGSAEIYDVVDKLPRIADSLVVGAELRDGGYWLVLFVVLDGDTGLADELAQEIKEAIRTQVSPLHVPDDVIALTALPHTRTGKRLEIPVKRLIQGQSLARVAASDAVDDYAALAQFTAYAGGPGKESPRTDGY